MKLVYIIDDQDHALKQIIYEFPNINKDDIQFQHFSSIAAFRSMNKGKVFAVFLDFFLSKDRDYGASILPEIECEHLVCFSSKKEMSDHMKTIASENYKNKIENVYSVQKIKNNIRNSELENILTKIFDDRTK